MKFELNFLPDQPTLNGRIYREKDLREIFSKKDIPVTLFPSRKGEVDLKNIIGYANLSEFKLFKIEFDITPVNTDLLNVIENSKLTTSLFGNVTKNKFVEDLHLVCLYPTNVNPEYESIEESIDNIE